MIRSIRFPIKAVSVFVLCIVMMSVLSGCSKLDYRKAVELYELGGYEAAKAAFEALGDYEDSAEYASKSGQILDYREAIELYAEGKYNKAAELFAKLDGYEKSADYLKKAEDKLLEEKIVGRWKTEEVDLGKLLLGYLKEEMSTLGLGAMDFELDTEMSYSAYYIFEDYGVVRQELEKESFTRFFESAAAMTKETMIALCEQELAAVVEAYGISLQDVYASLGVSSVQEYLAANLGMSIDEFLAFIFNEESFSAMLESSVVDGAWYLKDGRIYIVAGHDMETAEYDPETDRITVLEIEIEDDSGLVSEDEMALIYPYTMTRAAKLNPKA